MISKLARLYRYAQLARRQSGKSLRTQAAEIVRLAMGEQRLGVEEYYEFEIFDDRYYPPARKRDCIGWRASARIDRMLNHDYWRAAANDKVLNYAILGQLGIPHPETIATYSASGRRVGGETVLRNQDQLARYLREQMPFPVFIKPIHGSYGRGTYSLLGYDPAADIYRDSRGKTVPFEELRQSCCAPQYQGMLFQKRLQAHPRVGTLIGDTVSCVRVIVALVDGRPKIHMAFWKIARTHNVTDNFCMGESGNLLAWLNKDTGTIERLVGGFWPEHSRPDRHPDTGAPLLGETLPDWPQAVAICLELANHFPGLRLQHWDVAFCPDGPVIMELNTEADLGVPQFLGHTAFVDAELRTMLAG